MEQLLQRPSAKSVYKDNGTDFYNAAIYCRLSKDDESHGESSSIKNQKTMLSNYVTERNWRIAGVYVDDGISGTTFERSGFKQMITDVENGKINLVITKDLSRLGRDYLKTGFYTECFFPENGVRYIAVNDGIDTLYNDNDIAPFKNILNELYAKDISKKVKSSYKVKFARGDYHGAFAPFGYAKDPNRKGKLMIDEESSQTVRLIYDLAKQGKGETKIRTILRDMQVLTPAAYLNKNNPDYYAKLFNNAPEYEKFSWSIGMVVRILKNEIYIGNMIHNKEAQVSFKDRRRHVQPRNKWIRSENTHEPIIERDVWYLIQERFQHRGCQARINPTNIFQRIACCSDCGRSLWLTPYEYCTKTKKKTNRRYLNCSTNRDYGGKYKCATHSINYKTLCDLVLNDIRQYSALALEKPDELLKMLNDTENAQRQKAQKQTWQEHKDSLDRLNELERLIQKLFEENVAGRMSDTNYEKLFKRYEKEQEALEPKVKELSAKLKVLDEERDSSQKWMDLVAKYRDLQELNAEIVNELIEKIIIHQSEKIDGKRSQKIEIFYRFIGKMTV